MQASDADLNTMLTYSISGDSYPLGFFKINPYTGLIQTARRLDNEASSLVTLTVQASDGLNSVCDHCTVWEHCITYIECACVCVCLCYVCMCMCVYICMCVCACVHVCVGVYVYVCVCLCVCVYVYIVCACVHVCLCVWVCHTSWSGGLLCEVCDFKGLGL